MSDKLRGGIKAGSTDVSLPVELRSSTDSTEVTGKTHSDITASYWRQGGTRTAISGASLASVDAAHSDGGFKEVDSTNMPGIYRFDVPDAAVATGADWVVVSIKVTGAFVQHFMFALTTDVLQTGDSYARLGEPAGASIAADLVTIDDFLDTEVAAIKAKTDNLPTDPADQSAVEAAITAATSGLATAAALSTVAGYIDTEVAAIKAKTDNLPASPAASGDIPTAAAVADAVWDEALSGHATAGSTGAALTDVLEDTATTIPAALTTIDDFLDTEVAAIKAKTDNLPTDPADQSAVEAAITAATSGLATAAALSTVAGYIDTEVAAIKAKTDNLPASPAASGDIPSAAAVADAVWDEALSGHATAGTAGAALSAANAPTAAAVADAVWDEALSGHATAGTAGQILQDLTPSAGGSGAYAVTVTVTDGTNPLEGAMVRVKEGVTTHVLETDASGEATFALDAATYSVRVTKSGYTFTPTTRTVTGEETGTLTNDLVMTAVAVASPDEPTLCRVSGTLILGTGEPASGITVEFLLQAATMAKLDGNVIAKRKVIVTTNDDGELQDSDGNAYVDLARTDLIEPAGAVWKVTAKDLKLALEELTLTTSSYDLADLVDA